MIVDQRQEVKKDERTGVVLFDLPCNVYVNGPLQEESDECVGRAVNTSRPTADSDDSNSTALVANILQPFTADNICSAVHTF